VVSLLNVTFFFIQYNALEGKHISQRKWEEKSDSRRKGIKTPDQPYADLLFERAPALQDFVAKNSALGSALANPSNVVAVDTAAKNRSRDGRDLASFSSYSHKSKTWFLPTSKVLAGKSIVGAQVRTRLRILLSQSRRLSTLYVKLWNCTLSLSEDAQCWGMRQMTNYESTHG
jgi:hypothetical protein